MKRLQAAQAILVVYAILTIACGSGGDSGGGGGSTSAPPPPPPPPPSVGTGGSGGTAGTFSKTTTVDGLSRTYTLYVPSSAMTAQSSGPIGMVMGWHGAGDTGSAFISWTGLSSAASANSMIMVGADALPGTGGTRAWFLSTSEGWTSPDGTSSSLRNDMLLLLKIRDEVGALYNVHTKKMFACGFSRGAGFTAAIAECAGNPSAFSGTFASPFAAYGIDAGYDPFGGTLSITGVNPKRDTWIIHGTSDGAVPYSSGKSLSDSMTAAGFPVTFTTITGAPHTWLWSSTYGHTNQELFDFFLAHPLP